MSDAQIHAEIAKRVYPDETQSTFIEDCGSIDRTHILINSRYFNLLETDSNGNPTQQAKASSLDVIEWMANILPENKRYDPVIRSQEIYTLLMNQDNPCSAIYEAAKEIVNE